MQSGENPSNIDVLFELTNLREEVEALREIYSNEALEVTFHGDQKINHLITGLAGTSKYAVRLNKAFFVLKFSDQSNYIF